MFAKRNLKIFLSVYALLLGGSILSAHAALRNAKISDKMPPFTLTDLQGKEYAYRHGRGRVLVVAFVAADQKHSERAALDMQRIFTEISHRDGADLDMAAVTTDFTNKDYFTRLSREDGLIYPILFDSDYKLWGQLGVIATPTVILVDKNDTIAWINAGHGYDFLPALRVQVETALGLRKIEQPDTAGPVESPDDATDLARMKTHVRMALMLKEKGRLDSALDELRKAYQLVPDSFEVRMEMAEILCQTRQPETALEVLEKLEADNQIKNAHIKMVLGWAYSLKGEPERAEKLLSEAIKLNPKSTRALYELGKIYQARREYEKAVQTYYQALAVTFNETPVSNLPNNDNKKQ